MRLCLRVNFPNIEEADEDGLLAIGASTDPHILIQAYSSGIFPWPYDESEPLAWFAPNPRGVIFKKDIHFSKSLLKFIKKTSLVVKINIDFSKVIQECANVKRKNQPGTWIYKNIVSGYTELFNMQKAYCISVYNKNEMVGGLYGVCIGELISGESMFFKEDNASKLALYTLLTIVKKKNIPLLDTQMVTPIIASFGGKNIDRSEFMKELSQLDLSKKRDDTFNAYD